VDYSNKGIEVIWMMWYFLGVYGAVRCRYSGFSALPNLLIELWEERNGSLGMSDLMRFGVMMNRDIRAL